MWRMPSRHPGELPPVSANNPDLTDQWPDWAESSFVCLCLTESRRKLEADFPPLSLFPAGPCDLCDWRSGLPRGHNSTKPGGHSAEGELGEAVPLALRWAKTLPHPQKRAISSNSSLHWGLSCHVVFYPLGSPTVQNQLYMITEKLLWKGGKPAVPQIQPLVSEKQSRYRKLLCL